jgi:hypothetical protein
VTNECIYNYKHKSKHSGVHGFVEIKRVVPLINLCGLTRSTNSSSKEFVMHISGEYDYRFKSDM